MSDDIQEQPGVPENDLESTGGESSVIDKSKRKPLLAGLVIVVVTVGLIWFVYDLFIGSRTVSTDNAYVAGEIAQVTPETSGRIAQVFATDTQPVRKGQILFRIDDADQKLAVEEARAALAYAERRYGQSLANNEALGAAASATTAQIATAQARLASSQAALDKARKDYDRRAALSGSGAVSAEELTAAREALASAQAAVREAQASVAQARANAVSARQQEQAARALTRGTSVTTAPEVLVARSRLATAELDLKRTVVRAPIDGVVSKRSIQVGQRVQSGETAMVIVPVHSLYVDANFKETQLGKVRPGQSATLRSDLYGSDVVYHGKVVGFSGGTGAAFSLIPAQNATGNWIKVVQRLPVRIELDPKELKEHPLRIGLSMEAEIDLTSKD